MNLLSLILVMMAIIVAGCVFYVAWQVSSGEFESRQTGPTTEKEPGETKES
jgi:flagellar basal body-associated protein FliL